MGNPTETKAQLAEAETKAEAWLVEAQLAEAEAEAWLVEARLVEARLAEAEAQLAEIEAQLAGIEAQLDKDSPWLWRPTGGGCS